MSDLGVKVRYIHHSGFLAETANSIFVFDYFKGALSLGGKKAFVLASHEHFDHFSKKIFEWAKEKADITYILSSDIRRRPEGLDIKLLSPYEETVLDGVTIKAFGSTDAGVSFLVRADGVSIFHAGDLNWWHWEGEPDGDNAHAEKWFKEEIAKIKGEVIDLAFFPVDPRQEHNSDLGADYFIQEIAPKFLIPMHFGDEPAAAVKYAAKMQGSGTKVITLSANNQEVTL